MTVAFIVVMPIGFLQALDVFGAPLLILAGIGVGGCSSVIPYVCDQLAMSRLPRASFALLLALLPATATIIGIIVLRQVPSAGDVLGVAMVMAGVALHRPAPAPARQPMVLGDASAQETQADGLRQDLEQLRDLQS